jgi:hypothetical protein
MKLYIPLLLLFVNLLSTNKELNISDFDYELGNIVQKFKLEIMDKDKCADLKDEVSDLAEEIQKKIEKEENSESEKAELKQLKKEADAVEEFISVVGNCSNNMFVDIEKIYLANQRINSSIGKISTDKFCCEIFSFTINNYVSTLAFNNSLDNYTVSYAWKSPKNMNKGSGTMGLPSHTARHVYDNRSNTAQKNIILISVKCTKN